MPNPTLTYQRLSDAVAGSTAAIRSVTALQPAGGKGDKIFPATYEGGSYATEERIIDGKRTPCVLIDSVASQANRMEQALRAAHRRYREDGLAFPLVLVGFAERFPDLGEITALDASHRLADAIFRDSTLGGVAFRDSPVGKALDDARITNATPLYRACPHALLFGLWDSTGPLGGMGAKFPRCLVSEIVGIDAVAGKRVSSRLDPLQIAVAAGPLYAAKSGGWTFEAAKASGKGKDVKVMKPSEINHGNVTPTISDGGFTIDHARQVTVLSLPGLRRLRFPLAGGKTSDASGVAARTVLAAMALVAMARQRQEGYDLRSRCHFVATAQPDLEFVPADGGEPAHLSLDVAGAEGVFAEAVQVAAKAGVPWDDQDIVLTPTPFLVDLIARSRAAHGAGQVEDG